MARGDLAKKAKDENVPKRNVPSSTNKHCQQNKNWMKESRNGVAGVSENVGKQTSMNDDKIMTAPADSSSTSTSSSHSGIAIGNQLSTLKISHETTNSDDLSFIKENEGQDKFFPGSSESRSNNLDCADRLGEIQLNDVLAAQPAVQGAENTAIEGYTTPGSKKLRKGNRVRIGIKTKDVGRKSPGDIRSFLSPSSSAGEVTRERSCTTVTADRPKQKHSYTKSGRSYHKSCNGHHPADGHPSPKLTDFYPAVRRSNRVPETQLKRENGKLLEHRIVSGCEDGLKIVDFPGKGRGIVATKPFSRGEFVVEYRGDLVDRVEAANREASYSLDPSVGCYMYYFIHRGTAYCVDATEESPYLGRLINHSAKTPNCSTRTVGINGVPHLILVAKRRIVPQEELLYNYGERNKDAIDAHPWLVAT